MGKHTTMPTQDYLKVMRSSVEIVPAPGKHAKCDHMGYSEEAGFVSGAEDCGHGCKVMRCTRCKSEYPFHLASYNCPRAGK